MILTPHPSVLRKAAESKVRASRRPISSIAAEMGLSASTLRKWSRRGGWRDSPGVPLPQSKRKTSKRKTMPVAPGARLPLEGRALRAALRRHVARQIARFDAALDAEAVPDSSRVLRDLGGLKRLLDELATQRKPDDHSDAGGRHGAEPGSDDTDAFTSGDDLPTLRAEIARRYAAFAGERPDGCVPGEPTAGAVDGPPA